MSLPLIPRLVVFAIAFCVGGAATSFADTIHYVLTSESQLIPICRTCDELPGAPEALRGTFDLTVMPVPAVFAVEAMTAVNWESDSFAISGAGFLQRLGPDRLAMVIDARINGIPTLLTSGRRQPSTPGDIRIHLSTRRSVDVGYVLRIVAAPVTTDGPDEDRDGIPDSIDNCPAVADHDQGDSDYDGVGNECDACPGTPLGSPVLDDGCAPNQRCACEGPTADEDWSSPRDYVQCVARTLKQLLQQRKLSRSEVRQLVQDAVRSGCGQRVLALLY